MSASVTSSASSTSRTWPRAWTIRTLTDRAAYRAAEAERLRARAEAAQHVAEAAAADLAAALLARAKAGRPVPTATRRAKADALRDMRGVL